MNDLTPPVSDTGHAHTIRYWLKGEPVQNYGDFLSELLVERLFSVLAPGRLRVIGSCLADKFVPADVETDGPIVFWGCGARDEQGMSDAVRARVEIPSVRGPLTRAAMRLPDHIPLGDPGLLLPILHPARPWPEGSGRALLVPHFIEMRRDRDLLSLSGCDAVLRPNLDNSREALLGFIDRLAGARFVLAGSLHAAITACAYGVPFAFWDSGNIDVPFKWRDFAASVGIPCAFHTRLAAAEAWFARDVAHAVTIPPLWPMLAAAPLPVHAAVLCATIRSDVARHGVSVLAAAEPPLETGALMTALARQQPERGGSPSISPALAGEAAEPLRQAAHEQRELRALLETVSRSLEVAEMRAAREAGGRAAAEAEAQAAREAASRVAIATPPRASRWPWRRR